MGRHRSSLRRPPDMHMTLRRGARRKAHTSGPCGLGSTPPTGIASNGSGRCAPVAVRRFPTRPMGFQGVQLRSCGGGWLAAYSRMWQPGMLARHYMLLMALSMTKLQEIERGGFRGVVVKGDSAASRPAVMPPEPSKSQSDSRALRQVKTLVGNSRGLSVVRSSVPVGFLTSPWNRQGAVRPWVRHRLQRAAPNPYPTVNDDHRTGVPGYLEPRPDIGICRTFSRGSLVARRGFDSGK
jgi:hypothetical protein